MPPSDPTSPSPNGNGSHAAATEQKLTLSREIAEFRRSLPDLLRTAKGQFALFHLDQLLGTFTTRIAALDAGYARLGVDTPFLVKAIQPTEEPAEFIREPR